MWLSFSEVDAQLQVVRKLEEKEHLLQSNIGTGEKELGLRTQALEMNKRKVWWTLLFGLTWWLVFRQTNKYATGETAGLLYSLGLGSYFFLIAHKWW